METDITDAEFARARSLAHRIAGISLSENKKALVVGRLARRVKHHDLQSFSQYFDLIGRPDARAELQIAIDLLTTNETHFFRESRHFDYLKNEILPSLRNNPTVRVWSAACSSGEEPYSLAMVLQDSLGERSWEVLATDISTRILDEARAAHYPMSRASTIPKSYLHKYCLKGTGPEAGTFLIDRSLRARVRVTQLNLVETLPEVGLFDAIFLRNVMIYFDLPTKQQVIARLAGVLRPGGHLFVGHCESLHGVTDRLTSVRPAVYLKPRA